MVLAIKDVYQKKGQTIVKVSDLSSNLRDSTYTEKGFEQYHKLGLLPKTETYKKCKKMEGTSPKAVLIHAMFANILNLLDDEKLMHLKIGETWSKNEWNRFINSSNAKETLLKDKEREYFELVKSHEEEDDVDTETTSQKREEDDKEEEKVQRKKKGKRKQVIEVDDEEEQTDGEKSEQKNKKSKAKIIERKKPQVQKEELEEENQLRDEVAWLKAQVEMQQKTIEVQQKTIEAQQGAIESLDIRLKVLEPSSDSLKIPAKKLESFEDIKSFVDPSTKYYYFENGKVCFCLFN
jgi:flagellar biosynthesis GTPase FlhF